MEATQRLTVEKFQRYVQTKRDLYEACERNGFFLPSYKSPMVTEKYLMQVIQGEVWCPRYQEVKMLPCPKRPLKRVLLDKVLEALKTLDRDAGLTEEKAPDSKWLVIVLSTLCPEDEIFSKSYVPPPRQHTKASFKTVELPETFLESLPFAVKKAKACRLKVFQEGRAEQRLSRMMEAKAKLVQQIAMEQDKLEQVRTKKKTLDLRPSSLSNSAQPQATPSKKRNKSNEQKLLQHQKDQIQWIQQYGNQHDQTKQ